MELASLFLVRINLFFPFPVQWALICYTLQRLGQMTLAKGLDEQFWYKSDMKRLERIWIRWSTGERNPHLMLINVYACGIHLKHISIQKQAQCTRTKHGPVHGQGTGMRMAFHMPFLNWILWKCGIDSLFELTMILIIKLWGREMLMASCPPTLWYRDHGQKKNFPCFLFIKISIKFVPLMQRWKRDLLPVPDLGAMPSFTTSRLCSSPFVFPSLTG